jgi:hypothetical protein
MPLLSRPVDRRRLVLEGAEDVVRVIFHDIVGDGLASGRPLVRGSTYTFVTSLLSFA